MQISLIQTRIAWRQAEDNRRHLSGRFDLVAADTDLIVLPETFTTGFLGDADQPAEPMDGPTVAWLTEQARERDCAIAGSAVIEAQGRRNRFLLVTPDGAVNHYDKRHLFSYGGEQERYQAGDRRVVMDWQGWRVCPQICYDLRFPVWSRYRGDYDLLVFVANWPAPRIQAWSALLKARAIENQCYVVGLNRVGEDGNGIDYPGHSAVYDPLGETVLFMGGGDDIGRAHLSLERVRQVREQFPFWREADEFSLQSEA